MQAGLVDSGKDLAEEHIDIALALLDDCVKPEYPRDGEKNREANHASKKSNCGGDEEVHLLDSTKTC